MTLHRRALLGAAAATSAFAGFALRAQAQTGSPET